MSKDQLTKKSTDKNIRFVDNIPFKKGIQLHSPKKIMAKKIKGKVVYQNLGAGFWGIVDQSGNEYRPINMPEQLKYKGREVRVTIQKIDEEMSMFMWGTPVKIISFRTMTP